MKTDTELLNEIAKHHSILRQLSQEEELRLKTSLLEMHNYIIGLCDKYGLSIMLGGGSCLGSVRHKGFIPWDDDLDLMMPRNDYEKLINIYEARKVDSMFQFEYPNKIRDVKNTYLKVFLKNTVLLDIFDDDGVFPSGVFLDIFPIDYAPRNTVLRRLKALISDGIQFICTCTLYSQYPSKNLKFFYGQDKDTYRRYKTRLFIGNLFSIIPHRRWVNWFDLFNSKSRQSAFMTIPAGRNHYLKETLPKDTFLPVKESTFEGSKTYLPRDSDSYLTHLYGDYLKIPPVEKRERHFIVDFIL